MADPQYSFKSPRRQLFAFPPDVISSMLNNPSSHKGLLKLYQTCKYFYGKRPILIADHVKISTEEEDNPPIIELVDMVKELTDCFGTSWYKIYYKNVTKLQIPIWPTKKVSVTNYYIPYQEIVPPLPKLFLYSAEELYMSFWKIKYEDFVLLASENQIKHFSVNPSPASFIYHSDLSKATIDQILQCLLNVQSFEYYIDETCSAEVLTKLNQILFKNTFDDFILTIRDIHPTFDFNLLCEFIVKNSKKTTQMRFRYCGTLKEKLKLVIQKLDPKWKNVTHNGLKKLLLLNYNEYEIYLD